MVTLEMTEDEFQLITDWAMKHFWDDTQSFDDDISVDECLKWSKACLLMARLKSEADKHGIYFGFHNPFYEDEPNEKKLEVTTAFMKQYCADVQRNFERIKEEQKSDRNVEELIDPTEAYNRRYAEWAAEDIKRSMKAADLQTEEEEKTND